MNRYELVEKEVYKILEDNCFGNKKRQAYKHLFGVSELCIILAKKENLDIELLGCIGLLHDLSIYKDHSHFDHANRSSMLAKDILQAIFNEDEITIILNSIKNHSNKNKRDDIYSEILKICDVYNKYLYEPDSVLDSDHQYYLNLINNYIQ